MRKTLMTIFAVMLAFCIGLGGHFLSQTNVTYAEASETGFESRSYCTATLEDDFADDRVLVALNRTATLRYRQYEPEDFAEIDCISVEDLTEATTQLVKQQTEAERTGNWRGLEERRANQMLVETDEFRTTLCLELREKCKEKVLQAIKRLEQREDVLLANPDYFVEFLADPNPRPTY